MKRNKILVTAIFLLFLGNFKTSFAQNRDTFKYKITLQIDGGGQMGIGPVIFMNSFMDILQTVYPDGSPVLVLEGEASMDEFSGSGMIHFPSVGPNPSFYPSDEPHPVVSVTLDSAHITITSHIDSLQYAKIEGNQIAKKQQEFITKNFPEIDEIRSINERAGVLGGLMRDDESVAKYGKEMDELGARVGKLSKVCSARIKNNFDSYSQSIFFYDAVTFVAWDDFSSAEIYGMLERFPAHFQTSSKHRMLTYYGDEKKKFEENGATKIKAGSLAKDAKIYKEDSEESSIYRLVDNLKNNELLVLDFWASWCGPCRKEMPFMKSLHEKYKSEGVQIVGISTDDSVEKWKKALLKEDLPYSQYRDTFKYASKEFEVNAIPALFVIDSKGDIISTDRGEDLEDFIKRYLKKG